MKGDLTLKILTSQNDSLPFATLVRMSATELWHTSVPIEGPTKEDIIAALFRVAGNSCDDLVQEAARILNRNISTARFVTCVKEAYIWKREGLW